MQYPQWKVAQIKMIVKPGKLPEDVKPYRPISLLPIWSKILELLFLNRLTSIIEESSLIPDHQFGFRKGHGTIEQVHRVVNCINKAIDENKFCTAIFLNISEAFEVLPINYFIFLKSYFFQQIILYQTRRGAYNTSLYQCWCTSRQCIGPSYPSNPRCYFRYFRWWHSRPFRG